MYHRKPAYAGSFYSSDKMELGRIIDKYINDTGSDKIDGEIIGLVSPHAGYIYSGPIAGYSYAQLKDSQAELVIVLAPSHRARFDGASVIPEGIYETPLGDVDIDDSICKKLLERNTFNFYKEAHEMEHSLEVQVPFLKRVLNNFKIVPVIIGSVDLDSCYNIAQDIKSLLENEKRKSVIIMSTDLSHYNPYNNAVDIDSRFINSLKSFDENIIKDVLSSRKAEACGEGPVLTGVMLCKGLGAEKVEILKYANSGDTAGDKGQVVGYLSAAIVK